ncbi:MAG TPA: hypothetical protein VL137_15275 [Polyangiaceae bacterium]|nr:hypothetical protein [Polyangiaceae bacterium]
MTVPVNARRFLRCSIASLCALLLPTLALAQLSPEVEKSRARLASPRVDMPGDGVYGRLNGDLDIGLHLGAEYQHHLAPNADLSLWYFWTFGIDVAHTFDIDHRPDVMERTAVSLQLRPLFIPRWKRDLEQGPPLLDLILDSVALGAGAQLPHEKSGKAGPQISLSLAVPLFAKASGLWLETTGVFRFPSSHSTAAPVDNGSALILWLSWHSFFDSGLHSDPP